MDKFDILLNAEEQFAREVTLGVLYLRPLSVWHYLIPGMFIIDFLRRGSAIRKYTETFMFPRKLALSAARDLCGGKSRTGLDAQLEDATRIFVNDSARNRIDAEEVALSKIFDWFAEGFDTRDLKEAKALLEELA